MELLAVDDRLRVAKQVVRLPDGREVSDYIRVETAPFVVILAITEKGEIVCERQYKHGVGRTILTLAGGGIDTGERPQDAAKRELIEETGYVSDEWQLLAKTVTHGNAGGSTFYSFLARNCRKVTEPNSGDLETVQIEIHPLQKVIASFSAGESPQAGDATTLLHGLLALGLGPRPYPAD